MNCHPERSEGSAVCRKMQIPRFARDDKNWTGEEQGLPFTAAKKVLHSCANIIS